MNLPIIFRFFFLIFRLPGIRPSGEVSDNRPINLQNQPICRLNRFTIDSFSGWNRIILRNKGTL